MTPNKEKLNTLIEGLPVCSDAKVGIRALVAEITSLDLTPEPPAPTYRTGDRFTKKVRRVGCYSGTSREETRDYILAGLGDAKIVLINLANGLRSGPPVLVGNPQRITEKELKAAARCEQCSDHYFRKIFNKHQD